MSQPQAIIKPCVILIHPQLGENIGAVARAMSNFGLHELRLVSPRDGWPNIRANEVASGGESIIESASLYPDTISAIADIQYAYATTARLRDMEKPVISPDIAAKEIIGHAAGGTRTAILFGPERSGLTNEDIGWCNTLVAIPTAPENPSLNLAQSMVILGYEWWRQQAQAPLKPKPSELAPKQDWDGLFEQLERYLDEAGYFRVTAKKPIMWQNLRNMLLRSELSEQEIRSFRGLLRVLWEGRKIGSRVPPTN